MNRPFIAVPMGDPAGIGPEIVIKALSNETVLGKAKCVIIGDVNILQNACEFCDLPLKIKRIEKPSDGDFSAGILNVIHIDEIQMEKFCIGKIHGMCGKAAYKYIEKSIDLTLKDETQAVATPPINKESLKAGNVPFIGHTEIFGKLTNTKDPLTMFEVCGMRIFFLTRHVSLADSIKLITKERIIDYVKRCKEALKRIGITEGTMAIAGLNPHSGEHGLFGTEEMTQIEPAIEILKKEDFDVTGPIGADSVFHMALQGKFNCVLSLYHDQGHIAAKTYNFEKTIALTLGMPILRTSVDHGTAMDIAGKGIASETSMIEAILIAARYA